MGATISILISKVKSVFLGVKAIERVEIERQRVISDVQELVQFFEHRKQRMEVAQNTREAFVKWLNDSEELIQELDKLEKEMETQRFKTFLRFLRTKRIFREMQDKINTLNTTRHYIIVQLQDQFYTRELDNEYVYSEDFVCFKSTQEALDQLMEALKDNSSHIIGLYGKRGSGKTKLAEEVAKKAEFLEIFNEVAFATVPQNANIVRQIQEQIADSLNLRFERYSEAARAKTISRKIEREGRVLVILDDVRTKLELKDIGIPIKGNSCKVLLTARSQQECTLMNCQREIPLHPLSEEEAWTWLKEHSGLDDESSSSDDLLTVAREVANECKESPGTIEDVGSSLKGQPIEEWKALLDSLRHSGARYQIFLSFRGEDTRHSFTGFLYDALSREGFKTFMDDGGLEGGDQISQTLTNAIEASRLSIIVLSEHYAKSAWCLDELVKILVCKKMRNQLVWPIFYKVEPSDVRYQKNSYGEAMVAHEKRFGKDSEKVQRWRSALFEVAGLSGMAYSTGYEYKFIQTIVERAKNNKNRLYLQSTDME